ncbi:hypothetical protein N7508_011068 [Penicillium antarcticum]|uniref:uncharacterized protein n=1 Tax=Penicillium antarcticum TaxID=416450 RepID=UPI002381D5E2|nr:uncharacterized protein N7508_011068 [Penicillium antarcticum]KAJ5288293.1 hypothetical protein N7508_011068 [Penicillium antarcticum]
MSRNCVHKEMYPRHFALIYIDRDGNLRHQISPSLYGNRANILTAQVTARFLKVVAESEERSHLSRPAHSLADKHLSHASCHASFPTLRGTEGNGEMAVVPECVTQPASARTRATVQCRERVEVQDLSTDPHSASIPLRDSKFLRQYYEKVFKNLQQTNCRVIAKVYVKIVEPRKQVQYPYNGRRTVGGITYQMSPEETKPPWWPPGVSHREPDHLSKAERIALLVHILCDLRLSHGITAQKLKVAEQPSRRFIYPIGRSRLLDELYTVRDAEEKYLEGLAGRFLQLTVLPQLIIFQIGKQQFLFRRPIYPTPAAQ